MQIGIMGLMAFVGFYPAVLHGPLAREAAAERDHQEPAGRVRPDHDVRRGGTWPGRRAGTRGGEGPGPFAQELKRALRDVALGKSRRDALKELGERTGVPDLIQFTNAVIQAEAMGSSIGTVLRVQAEQLRVRRRQRAEEQAYKAPVKMLFPLVLCIFPTLFIVILGPAMITIMNGFPTK